MTEPETADACLVAVGVIDPLTERLLVRCLESLLELVGLPHKRVVCNIHPTNLVQVERITGRES